MLSTSVFYYPDRTRICAIGGLTGKAARDFRLHVGSFCSRNWPVEIVLDGITRVDDAGKRALTDIYETGGSFSSTVPFTRRLCEKLGIPLLPVDELGTESSESIEMRWIDRLSDATLQTLETMLGVKASLLSAEVHEHSFDLASLVGLGGKPSGVIVLACDMLTAARVAACLFECKRGDNVEEALGKVCSRIGTNLLSTFPEPDRHCRISLPMAVRKFSPALKYPATGKLRALRTLEFEGQRVHALLELDHSTQIPPPCNRPTAHRCKVIKMLPQQKTLSPDPGPEDEATDSPCPGE